MLMVKPRIPSTPLKSGLPPTRFEPSTSRPHVSARRPLLGLHPVTPGLPPREREITGYELFDKHAPIHRAVQGEVVKNRGDGIALASLESGLPPRPQASEP